MEKKTEKELLQEIENLRSQVEKLKQRKKYGLVWDAEREPEKVVLDCRQKLPILVEDPKKEIKGKKDEPINLLIEGDNYHSLSVLNYTHKNKIDVIYIDPPYNTGNKHEWKYNDHWVDEEDKWKHSKWLNFMEKRLKLAKTLLTNEGVIFISIDDNEVAQLKLLCNEIFGENNFIASFIWEKHKAPKNDNKYITTNHEYILLYAKYKENVSFNKIPRSEKNLKSFSNPDNDPRGDWISGPLLAPTFTKSTVFPIKCPDGRNLLPPKGKCWAFSKERIKELIEDKKIWFGKDGKNVPRIKRFLSELSDGIGPTSMLNHDELGGTQKASNDLKKIFGGEKRFTYPKPTDVIKRLFFLSSKKDSIVLDFFAGSGTSGHAVLDLNKEDNGSRKFILCTNNEDNNGDGLKIAEDICYPRIKNVSKGHKNAKGENIAGLGGNLRYYKTDFVETENLDNATDHDKIELTYKAGEMIAIRENTFEEIEKNDWWQIFSNEEEITAIYFKEDKSKLQKFVDKLDKMGKKVNLYIFSWGKNEYANEFPEYKNIKVKDIPEPLIDVYKEVANL